MKLLWLSHLVPYPPKGGVLQRSYHLLREVARSHDVTLLAFVQRGLLKSTCGSVEEGLALARRELTGFCRSVRFFDIPMEKRPLGRLEMGLRGLLTEDGYTINWLKSPEMKEALAQTLRTGQFDLLHFDTISLAPHLPPACEISAVLDHHNIESHMMTRRAQRESNPFLRAYFAQEARKLRAYEARTCSRFDLHITCSDLDSERLLEIDSSLNVQTVANGVDTEYFQPATDVHEIPGRLVFAGTMDWYPNRDAIRFFVRDVWPRLTVLRPNITMDLIGANPPEDLKAFSRADPRFQVLGFVDDVRPYLARAAVYVCPIRDGGGTKLKVLDAMAMGKALVAHPVACEGIRVQAQREVRFAETPGDFVREIVRLLDNPADRRRLGDSARENIIRHYSYRHIGRRLSTLYEQTAFPEGSKRLSATAE